MFYMLLNFTIWQYNNKIFLLLLQNPEEYEVKKRDGATPDDEREGEDEDEEGEKAEEEDVSAEGDAVVRQRKKTTKADLEGPTEQVRFQ